MQLGLRISLEKDTGAIWRQPCRNAALAFAGDAVWVTLLPWRHVCRERKDSSIDIKCLFLHPLPTLKENVWPFSLGKSRPWVCCRRLSGLSVWRGYLKVSLGVPLDLPYCRGIPLKRWEYRRRFTHCKQSMIFGFCFGWLCFFFFSFTVNRSLLRSGRSFEQSLTWTCIFSYFSVNHLRVCIKSELSMKGHFKEA